MAIRSNSRVNYRRRTSLNFLGSALLSISLIGAAVVLRPQLSSENVTEIISAPVVAEFDTVSVPVPVAVVPIGTRLKDVQFKNVSFPRHQLPPGALVDLNTWLDAVNTAPLPANLPVFSDNLSSINVASNPVVERIPPGMRAMTIRVDATTSVEGWAGSGSVVDVLLIERNKTSVVAEQVRILSSERSVSPVDGAPSPNVPSTVTLLVTQEQCLAINTAVRMGQIAFALRSLKDEEGWKTTSYSSDRLKGRPAATEGRPSVSGVIRIGAGKSEESYALSDGKWVRADALPDGFFIRDKD